MNKALKNQGKFWSITAVLAIITAGYFYNGSGDESIIKDNKYKSKKEKKSLVVNGYNYDGPEKYAYYQAALRAGQVDLNATMKHPQYPINYINQELLKVKKQKGLSAKVQSNATFVSRGPVNVPGRTRAIIVDPDDNTNESWFAAGVSGGIWKTTNSGVSWTETAPDLDNIQVVSLAMAASNTSVIYAGTGEQFGGGAPYGQNGGGIYKSVDKGLTWNILSSTLNNEFGNVSRIIVDPSDANILLASTAGKRSLGAFLGDGAIMRSIDGGTTWSKVYEAASRPVQQIIAAPSDFDIQYASVLRVGVVKSTDAGLTWTDVSTGLRLNDRMELGVSYSDPDKVYGSAVGGLSGAGADLYLTEDGGSIWNPIGVTFNNVVIDFLVQGSYDNTLLVNPFDDDNVYFGGVSLFSLTRNPSLDGGLSTSYSLDATEIEDFMSFVNFSANAAGGTLAATEAEAGDKTIEIRFGAGVSQKAHRFTVPAGAGSGVPATDYSYQDYVEVPFEVWNTTDNVQLMVSFRDQQNDGVFNLIEQNTDGDGSTHSREYLFVNNVLYNATTPDANIAVSGGHEHKEMHNVWPVLPVGATWNPGTLPTSKLVISSFTSSNLGGDLTVVTDARQAYNSNNLHIQGTSTGVHPDNHTMVAAITDQGASEFKIILGTDGGVYVSDAGTDPGVADGSWTWSGTGYNTSQFYGADKLAGKEQYMGGTQDNGTWLSLASEAASSTSVYSFILGGDGFEVVAHYTDPLKSIGSIYNNLFIASEDGWQTSYSATNGLGGNGPFVSRLSNAYQDPDVLFAVESTGVFKSSDFGKNWKSVPIESNWGFWSGTDVEVSKANPRFVWAGGSMDAGGSIQVSADGGESFNAVSNFADIGLVTGIYSHPTKDSTVFVTFAVANSPKILRTEDLGETWTDISGYSVGSASTGFPDVATFAVQAMPYDVNTYWAGTEIGIFETIDAGANWTLIDEFPSVSIWDFKIKDGQVVISTFGRGIWTADIPELAGFSAPVVTLLPTIDQISAPISELAINLTYNLKSAYDSTDITSNGVIVIDLPSNNGPLVDDYSFVVAQTGSYEVQVIGYKDGVAYPSGLADIEISALLTPVESYFSDFEDDTKDIDFTLDQWTIDTTTGGGFTRVLSTVHPYPTGGFNLIAQLNTPITVASQDALVRFDEIVLVEEGESGSVFGESAFYDYVIVEGSKDGTNWTPLLDGYDSDANSGWSGSATTATSALFAKRTVDIQDAFAAGDVILLRFRLFSDPGANGWGWGIENLEIQVTDADGDGYGNILDCDDTNSAINPGATEIPYNGIDDDCNASTPDDDIDQDGFVLANDCDDTNSAVNPDAIEIINNDLDDNCDGEELITGFNDDQSDAKVYIYPNPAVEAINVVINKTFIGSVKLQVIDLSGKVRTSTIVERNSEYSETKIDLSDLPCGMYLIKLEDSSTSVIKRIIIQ
jgi:photosystem II stability/assembly factor-like uncharacterized protein